MAARCRKGNGSVESKRFEVMPGHATSIMTTGAPFEEFINAV